MLNTDASQSGPSAASWDRSAPANGLPAPATVVESHIAPFACRNRTAVIATSPMPSRIARARARIAGVPPTTRVAPAPRVASDTTGAPNGAVAVDDGRPVAP